MPQVIVFVFFVRFLVNRRIWPELISSLLVTPHYFIDVLLIII